MVSFTLSYDKSILNNLRIEIVNAPQEIFDFVKEDIPTFLQNEITPLKTEPRLPSLPFVWSNDPVKQRKAQRYYFGVKLKGKKSIGGRHVRTHELVNRWRTEAKTSRNEATVRTFNDTPGLDFVQGPSQVPSHQESGWDRYDVTLVRAGERAVERISDKWLGILDKG